MGRRCHLADLYGARLGYSLVGSLLTWRLNRTWFKVLTGGPLLSADITRARLMVRTEIFIVSAQSFVEEAQTLRIPPL